MTTDQKPLPFIYQFAAGAVAGISEVCSSAMQLCTHACETWYALSRTSDGIVCRNRLLTLIQILLM